MKKHLPQSYKDFATFCALTSLLIIYHIFNFFSVDNIPGNRVSVKFLYLENARLWKAETWTFLEILFSKKKKKH